MLSSVNLKHPVNRLPKHLMNQRPKEILVHLPQLMVPSQKSKMLMPKVWVTLLHQTRFLQKRIQERHEHEIISESLSDKAHLFYIRYVSILVLAVP